MFRAPHTRGEAPVRREHEEHSTSVESLIALGLCATVLLASLALLRRSSDYSRTLESLVSRSPGPRSARVRVQSAPAGIDPTPDLVLVLALDGLRADHSGSSGYGRPTTPNLDALAREGVLFRNAGAQASHSLTSLKSLLTGKYPGTLMLEKTGADLLEQSIEHEPRRFLVETFEAIEGRLAADLAAKGFRTAAFGAGTAFTSAQGFASGFATFEELDGGCEAVLRRGLAWLDENPGTPTFLFLQADALACPYRCSPLFDGIFCEDHGAHARLEPACHPAADEPAPGPAEVRALTDHYDESLRSVDELLGDFLEALGQRKLLEKALLVVTASHGEALGENGVFGHGGLSPEELRVPLVLRFPRRWRLEPRVIEDAVELVDLLPTIEALCGAPLAGDLDGHSLLPTLLRGVRGRDYLVAQTSLDEGPLARSSPALRTLLVPGRWQILQDNERGEASFLALTGDARTRAVLPIRPEEFAPLLDLLLGRRPSDRRAPEAFPEGAFEAGIAHELEALGYDSSALAGSRRTSDLR